MAKALTDALGAIDSMPLIEEPVGGVDPWVDPLVTTQWHEVLAAYQRSGGLCGICLEPVDLDVKTGPRQPTIDHIVPRSREGSGERANLQLAHRGCNSRKGNRCAGV